MDEKVNEQYKKLFQGFSKLDRDERLRRLLQMGALSKEDICELKKESLLKLDLAENLIENVLGYFQMPLGVAANFVIDGKAYAIPMAVEETSIIAAASKTAKWVRENGKITTQSVGHQVIGQIQIGRLKNKQNLQQILKTQRTKLIQQANEQVAHGLVRRGGGVSDIRLRILERGDGGQMAVLHVYADTCDAMGANIINQVCEFLRPLVEVLTDEKVTMCILSNLVDSQVTKARVELKGIDADLMDKIKEGSLFAQVDPYRACTNNKGVLNGIDPILIATGNDWRAVEAGVHAYAARSGQYSSVTRWWVEGGKLIGEFEAPIILGVVGGVTKLHPTAKMCLRMMGIESAEELSKVCASVGLIQNLGAIRALMTVGITEGHMKLHIKNLSIGAGATEKEIPMLQKKLEEVLRLTKRISLGSAKEALRELRDQKIKTSRATDAPVRPQ